MDDNGQVRKLAEKIAGLNNIYPDGFSTTTPLHLSRIEEVLREAMDEAEEQGRYGGTKDLETLEHNTAIVYCALTGNKISKPFTDPYAVIAELEDQMTKLCEEQEKLTLTRAAEIADEWAHVSGDNYGLGDKFRAKAKELK